MLTTLISVSISLGILAGAFFLAKYVVEKQHRANVLEDSYKEAVEHIASLEREITGLNQQIEQLMYEAQQNGERLDRPRRWDPNPLNGQAR
jgi:peptidoglycan hydrolase CwlO-like protein